MADAAEIAIQRLKSKQRIIESMMEERNRPCDDSIKQGSMKPAYAKLNALNIFWHAGSDGKVSCANITTCATLPAGILLAVECRNAIILTRADDDKMMKWSVSLFDDSDLNTCKEQVDSLRTYFKNELEWTEQNRLHDITLADAQNWVCRQVAQWAVATFDQK